MRIRSLSLAVVSAALVLAGCGEGITTKAKSAAEARARQKPAATAAKRSGDHASGTVALAPSGEGAIDTASLHLSGTIARVCGIHVDGEASEKVDFEFDSAAISEGDRALLGGVARCMTDGALRGQSVKLVGRTDPRGEAEYNMGLGESRANAVQRYMHDLGVEKPRLMATSRGKIDAVGTDEASWARDRRVDIELLGDSAVASDVASR